MPTLQGEPASTVRQEPSLIAMTSSRPLSISTTVCLTSPPSMQRAPPWVRLASPEAMAASWLALGRSRRSETATGSPSADTTMAWATPGVRWAKLPTSQLKSLASLLSWGMAVLTRWRPGHSQAAHEVAGPLARIQVADQAAGLRPRWSLAAYCGPGRNNMPSPSTVRGGPAGRPRIRARTTHVRAFLSMACSLRCGDHADARGCRRAWCPGAGAGDLAGRARWPVAGRARPGRPGGADAGADRPDRVRGRRGGGRGHVPAGGRRVPAAGPARSDLAIQRRAAGRAEGRDQHRGGAAPAPAAARSQAGRARAGTDVVRTRERGLPDVLAAWGQRRTAGADRRPRGPLRAPAAARRPLPGGRRARPANAGRGEPPHGAAARPGAGEPPGGHHPAGRGGRSRPCGGGDLRTHPRRSLVGAARVLSPARARGGRRPADRRGPGGPHG